MRVCRFSSESCFLTADLSLICVFEITVLHPMSYVSPCVCLAHSPELQCLTEYSDVIGRGVPQRVIYNGFKSAFLYLTKVLGCMKTHTHTRCLEQQEIKGRMDNSF